MDQADWLASVQPLKMLASLPREASHRKLRLFGCACCRRIWGLLPSDLNRQAVLAVEEYPETPNLEQYPDVFTHPVLNEALCASSTVEHEHREDPAYWAVKYLGRSYYKCMPRDGAVAAAFHTVRRVARDDPARAEGTFQAGLLRCIFGNPFQPVPVRADMLTPTVRSLAQAAYDQRCTPGGELDPVLLSVLADALEEVGNGADLVAHLRSPGPHFRGCFPVDACLELA